MKPWLHLVIATFVAISVSSGVAHAATPTSINFDDVAAPKVITNQYEALGLYVAGTSPAVSNAIVPACANQTFATSGSNYLGPQPTARSDMTLRFSGDSVSRASAYVSFNLISSLSLTIDFVDTAGRTKSVRSTNPFGNGRPISSCTSGQYSLLRTVTVSAPEQGGIQNIAEIRFRPDSGAGNDTGFAIDDLVYQPPTPSTTSPTPPGAFRLEGGEATCSAGQPANRINWTASDRADSYAVWRSFEVYGGLGWVLVAANLPPQTRSFTDQGAFVVPGLNYTYRVQSTNSFGTTSSSNEQVLRTQSDCGAAEEFTVAVTPAAVSLARNAVQSFTVSTAGQLPIGGTTIQWELLNDSLGQITPDPLNPSRATVAIAAAAGLARYDDVVRASVSAGGRTASDTASITVVSDGGGDPGPGGGDPPGDPGTGSGRATILGDIFAGGNVSNISVDVNAVVSAKGTIENVNSQNLIQDYSRDAVEETGALLNTIVAERAVELPSTTSGQTQVSGRFNLNPKTRGNPSDSATSAANPEGGVWYVRGDLVLSDVQFIGRGTIVVDGNVRFEGSTGVRYADSDALLGVIARGGPGANGDISVIGVQTVVGAYYAPNGTITIGEGVTVPRGLFVGESIALGAKDISVTYDSRITKNPPLGFSASFAPSISEVTP